MPLGNSASSQRAGANSIQSQTHIENLQVGVTAAEARQIALDALASEFLHWGPAAEARAHERVNELVELLTEKLEQLDRMDFLAEPDNLLAFRKAGISAAASANANDYEVLAEMLATRSQTDARIEKSAIDRAISVVNEVDAGALEALTIIIAVQHSTYSAPYISDFIRQFSVVNADDLPTSEAWIDHCVQLGLLVRERLAPSGSSLATTLASFPQSKVACFDLAEAQRINDAIVEQTGARQWWFGGHPLFADQFACIYSPNLRVTPIIEHLPLREDLQQQVAALLEPAMRVVDETQAMVLIASTLQGDASIIPLKDWWDRLPILYVTPAGKALALTNAKSRFHRLVSLKKLLAT